MWLDYLVNTNATQWAWGWSLVVENQEFCFGQVREVQYIQKDRSNRQLDIRIWGFLDRCRRKLQIRIATAYSWYLMVPGISWVRWGGRQRSESWLTTAPTGPLDREITCDHEVSAKWQNTQAREILSSWECHQTHPGLQKRPPALALLFAGGGTQLPHQSAETRMTISFSVYLVFTAKFYLRTWLLRTKRRAFLTPSEQYHKPGWYGVHPRVCSRYVKAQMFNLNF